MVFWVVGLGVGGLGFGPQPPIPNPQSPIPNPHNYNIGKNILIIYNLIYLIFRKYNRFNL
jgi:hypothetical protein